MEAERGRGRNFLDGRYDEFFTSTSATIQPRNSLRPMLNGALACDWPGVERCGGLQARKSEEWVEDAIMDEA